jgi:hypothetical protein
MFVYRPELLLMSDTPEFTVKLMRPKEVKVGEPAEINGKLEWYGVAQKFARVELTDVSGKAEPLVVRTSDFGSFRTNLTSGEYVVTGFERERVPLNLAKMGELTLKDDQRVVSAQGYVLFAGAGTVVTPGDLGSGDDSDKYYLTQDGESLHLGSLTFDPSRQTADKADAEGPAQTDRRLEFSDQRLSYLSVAKAVSYALVGILALAAGIAGYMFSELRVWVRVAMLIAAALLLSPNLEIGGTEIGMYTNIAGGAMFVVLAALNKQKTNAELRAQPGTAA